LLVREDVTCGAEGVDAPVPSASPGVNFVMPLIDCGVFAATQKGWVQFSHDPGTGKCTVYTKECPEASISGGAASLYKPFGAAK